MPIRADIVPILVPRASSVRAAGESGLCRMSIAALAAPPETFFCFY